MQRSPDVTTPVREGFLSFQPPAIDDAEIEAVSEALRSGWLTSGPRAAELEERFAELTGARHALAVASGTAALHLSLVAAGIGPGDEVITSPITWPATANVVEHAGARPIFCDVRDSDLNIDADLLPSVATERTRAVMPVDLAGQPCELDPIMALARERGWLVIEDAAHAVESRYRGRKVGAIADATCFSLYATKNVAAGEGGIIATNSDELAAEVRELRLMRRGEGSLYDIRRAGFKANLADLNAAVALVQLDKLERHRAIRLRHVAAYDAAVAELAGIEPLAREGGDGDLHAMHLYVVRIEAERAGATRDEYQQALTAENIGTSIHFLPVHRLTYYRERYPDQPSLPVAERAGSEVLSLPLSPAHSDADIRDAIEALRRVHERFSGR
jgi:dTDP-4-amino-4,6-dideoxygalactose transaminase